MILFITHISTEILNVSFGKIGFFHLSIYLWARLFGIFF